MTERDIITQSGTISIDFWWVEPYTDFEGHSGWIVMYQRTSNKQIFSHGAMYSSMADAVRAGVVIFGTEPNYSFGRQALLVGKEI